ncbi:hypothetical protein TNCV_392721 [Trichonephila clavipes]|nr:hypothetical protein TNCV_392721 [Trichonephila clavipes]
MFQEFLRTFHDSETFSPKRSGRGLDNRLVAAACHEFKPSTTENLPCRGAMYFKSVNRGMQAQVSSSSLACGSKLRGLSPKALN